MTREEKQKAIDALKISAPVMAVTREEFNDYIQILNKIMDWLEQESVLDKVRAEIEKVFCTSVVTNELRTPMEVKTEILQIIDKYR